MRGESNRPEHFRKSSMCVRVVCGFWKWVSLGRGEDTSRPVTSVEQASSEQLSPPSGPSLQNLWNGPRTLSPCLFIFHVSVQGSFCLLAIQALCLPHPAYLRMQLRCRLPQGTTACPGYHCPLLPQQGCLVRLLCLSVPSAALCPSTWRNTYHSKHGQKESRNALLDRKRLLSLVPCSGFKNTLCSLK